jgi:hypothetical protein
MAREETKAKFRTSIDFLVGSPIHPKSRGICHNAFKTIWRSQKQNSLVSSLSQQTLNETFTTRKQPLRPLGGEGWLEFFQLVFDPGVGECFDDRLRERAELALRCHRMGEAVR